MMFHGTKFGNTSEASDRVRSLSRVGDVKEDHVAERFAIGPEHIDLSL